MLVFLLSFVLEPEEGHMQIFGFYCEAIESFKHASFRPSSPDKQKNAENLAPHSQRAQQPLIKQCS